MVTWRQLVAEATEELHKSGVADPEISARFIGQAATGADGAEWLEALEAAAGKRQVAAFDAMIGRRQEGEPLQYVIGRWGFRHLDLFVDHRVLIPRPETEVVAGAALAEVERLGQARDGDANPVVVADLGTGSGAIGLSIAAEYEHCEVWLTDVSEPALAVARANLVGVGRAGTRVRAVAGDWFGALPETLRGRIDVVVSNPPYVGVDDDVDLQIAWEPAEALYADGPLATEHIETLIEHAPRWLEGRGSLIIEMAPAQIAPMTERAERQFSAVENVLDLSGRQRAIVARFPLRSADIRSGGTT